MEAHPPIVEESMAVEATNVPEGAAALQEPTQEGLLTNSDLEESPSKKRKEEGEIIIEPKMKAWLESIESTAEGDA